ncbi:AAA family ATPase [Streptomyces sp. NPDC007896]|uniref:AAA family ATPase n=1 Tax=Streptomyces sp. NPDC007896 TaxID=3364784 RepID=UPI0036ECAE85
MTGRDGRQATAEDSLRIADRLPYCTGNLGLRLPKGIIGIDVDEYDEKHGYSTTILELTEKLGPLPFGPYSTSRGPGVSGIWLFHLPGEYRELKDVAGPDVEVIQWHHRYTQTWPSVHPRTGGIYRWHAADGTPLERPPRPEELPTLPQAWADYLTKQERVSRPSALPVDPRTGEVLEGFQGTPEGLRRRFEQRLQEIRDEPTNGRGEQWINNIAMEFGHYVPHQLHEHDVVRGITEAVDPWTTWPDGGRAKVLRGIDTGLPDGMAEPEVWTDPRTPSADGEGSATLRRLKLTPASQIEPEPVIWAWEPESGQGRIPAGALTLAAGREGTGKSSFGIWLAAQLSRGTLPGTFYGQPRNVLYAAVEDSWSRTLVPRLMAAGADLTRVFRVDIEVIEDTVQEAMICLPMDVSLIEQAIKEHDVAALIVDPLMSTLGRTTDAHRTQDVRQALEPLVRMAGRTRALTLGIAHFNKTSGNDAAQLISGSGAFKDLARSVLVFARNRETEEQVMSQVKNSLGRLDLPHIGYVIEGVDVETPSGTANVGRLAFTGPVEMGVEDMLSAPIDAEEAGERAEATAWLLGYLTEQGGEAARMDVVKAGKAQGFSETTIRRARQKGRVTFTERSGFGGGTVWRHPENSQSGHSRVSQVTSQSPGPTDLTVESVTRLEEPQSQNVTVPQGQEMGPCTRCKTTPTRRYGAGANPLCENCRNAAEESQ